MKALSGRKNLTLVILAVLCLALPVQAADTDDALLSILPQDSMFCLRINDFNQSLGKLDQYLAGASPIPMSLAMLVNMQLGAVTGDPMLTGLDQGGDFAIFAILPQADQTEPPFGILIPVKSFKEFVKTNPNCKPAEDGLTLLSPPASPMSPAPSMGSFLLAPVGDTYALVVHESAKASMAALQKALADDSKISKRLSDAQAKDATTAPVWVFVDVAGLYTKYNPLATAMLGMAQMEMAATGNAAEMMEFQFKMLSAMFKELGSDLDSSTLSLTPEPTVLGMDISLRAKDNSEMAKMLTAPAQTTGYKLTSHLDDKNAVNALMKMNRHFMQTFYDKMFDAMETAANDPTSKEQTAKMKALTNKAFDAMGDEVAISYSYAAGMPPFQMQETIEVKDQSAMKDLMTEGMDYANSMYKSMGIPAKLEYQPGVSTYKDVAIDTVSISFENGDDPNNLMQKEVQKMYGDDFKYYLAQTPDKLYITMGPDSEQALKNLIDEPASSAPAGDIKIAMDTLQKTPYNDFVCSVNIIKLLKGFGGMMQAMGEQMGPNPVAGMFSDLSEVETQSCLVAGGKIADGSASVRLALPKQHLIEIIAVGMQIQQKAMQAQMQGSAAGTIPQPQETAPVQTQKNPLSEWVGKPAPELKMVDLDGKIHRVSRLKGKKAALDFWATWCPPCKKSIPDLIKLRTDTKESEVVIIGISDEPTGTLSPFVKEHKINYPIVADAKDLPAPYGQVTGIPTLFLIDSSGIIQDVIVGYHPLEEIQTRLNKIN